MKNVKFLQKLAMTLMGSLTVIACSNGDAPTNGNLSIAAKSTYTKSATLSNAKATNAVVDVTDFLLNLKEFKIEVDQAHEAQENESWDDDGRYDFEDEQKLQGPFELDLLSGQISFLSVDLPNSVYEEIKFKFGKSTDSNSQLFDKSILIKGTIDNTPFVFWHDFEDEVEVDFENPQLDIVVQNSADELIINFDLTSMLDAATGVDLSLAKDMNNDGLIEISPVDNDGNNQLAQQLKQALKSHIDLLDR
ncbi:MAG TPA: hypothetical protein ENK46_13010 [Flavobacteriia bacterium]|nr:hypothetical protein [Flavobacteriia bacterium]